MLPKWLSVSLPNINHLKWCHVKYLDHLSLKNQTDTLTAATRLPSKLNPVCLRRYHSIEKSMWECEAKFTPVFSHEHGSSTGQPRGSALTAVSLSHRRVSLRQINDLIWIHNCTVYGQTFTLWAASHPWFMCESGVHTKAEGIEHKLKSTLRVGSLKWTSENWHFSINAALYAHKRKDNIKVLYKNAMKSKQKQGASDWSFKFSENI